MDFLRKLSKRQQKVPQNRGTKDIPRSEQKVAFSVSTDAVRDAPPAYSPSSATEYAQGKSTARLQGDSAFDFLARFDTVFLIDDSGSMAGSRWRQTSVALSAIIPICTEYDANGIDIYFLNARNPLSRDSLGGFHNVTTEAAVREIFSTVEPSRGTPTGTRLNAILKDYIAGLSKAIGRAGRDQQVEHKPLNIIVITDGAATDDVESTIVSAAKKLDKMGAEPWQVGVQFFQVGNDKAAAKELEELDDILSSEHGVRDMVDTVPWTGGDDASLTAEGIMKVTMGAINRKFDRKTSNDPNLRKP